MGEFVTIEEFAALRKDVDWLKEQNTSSREWQAKYGERIDTIYKLVEDLSGKPTKRWDAVVAAIIAAVISAGIALLLK